MTDIYWIGPRQSDIENIEDLFKGSVTIYGNNHNGNIAYCGQNNRINHNIYNEFCEVFFQTQLTGIINQNPDAKFLFYNQEYAYQYGQEILAHSIGINDKLLLESLSDKAQCRYLLSNIVEIIPYITLKGKDCSYNSLKQYFPHDSFVLQKVKSSGGDGTYHITSDSTIIEKISFDSNGEYILSPYLRDSISLNIHLIISEKKIILFPASIQIICELQSQLLYSGADFMCFQQLPREIKEQLDNVSRKIGLFLQARGYRGILGVDYLLYDNNLYFMELNARFQASTELLNKELCSNDQLSMQALHLCAFEKKDIIFDNGLSVKYSNFAYTTNNVSNFQINKILSSDEIFQIQLDGYCNNQLVANEKNIYLFRSVFTRNICAISNGKVILHPNICTENIKPYLSHNHQYFKEYTKFALLNHGVTLTSRAIDFVQKSGTIKEAVFDAIDITIFHHIKVNVPTLCKFSSLSPFTIDVIEHHLVLLFENEMISEIAIDLVPDTLMNKKTSSGVPFETIINIATDRIRINPAPICVYKTEGTYCHFCNLPTQNYHYNIDDVKEVIDYCIVNVEFRHFLIGGGTYSLNGGWNIIIQISEYIRKKCSKDIYLMCIPPQNVTVLDKLKRAGITEIAFNIEIFDSYLRKQIMPGKGSISLDDYFTALTYAVKLWGNTGKVRSLLIYGIDNDDTFITGIESLCHAGVEPIISIFRPLNGTDLQDSNPPSTVDIFSIYEKCNAIAEKYSLILGPDCVECQNNTLSFPKRI